MLKVNVAQEQLSGSEHTPRKIVIMIAMLKEYLISMKIITLIFFIMKKKKVALEFFTSNVDFQEDILDSSEYKK